MDNPAELSDVEGSFERPLTADEKRVIPKWLGTAWRTLTEEVRGIPARCELDEAAPGYLSSDTVKDVVVAMVERKLRNPDGFRTWGGDTESSTIDSTLSSGQIYVTALERARLAPTDLAGGAGGFYSIQLGRP
jgi:hypothetical protein